MCVCVCVCVCRSVCLCVHMHGLCGWVWWGGGVEIKREIRKIDRKGRECSEFLRRFVAGVDNGR